MALLKLKDSITAADRVQRFPGLDRHVEFCRAGWNWAGLGPVFEIAGCFEWADSLIRFSESFGQTS